MGAVPFFYTPGRVIEPDQIVMGCYELAKFYQVDPRIFLAQSITDIGRHRYWTVRLTEKIREAQEAETPSDG